MSEKRHGTVQVEGRMFQVEIETPSEGAFVASCAEPPLSFGAATEAAAIEGLRGSIRREAISPPPEG